MTITVTNQKPAVLDARHTIPIVGDYDPMAALQSTLIDPLLTPLVPALPASITDSTGTDLVPEIPGLFAACLGEDMDVDAQDRTKELLAQTLVHYDHHAALPVTELFAVQAGRRRKMPMPGPRVIYGAADLATSAKSVLSGASDIDEFFASVSFTYHPDTLGFWFESSDAFADFTTWLDQQIQILSAALPGDTVDLLKQLRGTSLKGLTESLRIRRDDADQNQEQSFARVVVNLLMTYMQGTPSNAGALPFTVGELFHPCTLVFVNLEAHARATPATIAQEWQLINAAITSPIKVISHRKLAKLTALPRAAARSASQAAALKKAKDPAGRSAKIVFRKAAPSPVDLYRLLTRVLTMMGKVNQSQNIQRMIRSSFAKANRRNPDDYNKPGKIMTISYLPDLHLFLDCSGSISERNYQESVMMLIRLAKKLGINIYFSSFSHVLSQEVMLRTAGKTEAQIWKEFRRLPKVAGGTEYKQVWDYINAHPERRRRLSLMITDFEWWAPAQRVDHPKNLYYAPCSAMDWSDLSDSARSFSRSMKHIEPTIGQRLLGMVA